MINLYDITFIKGSLRYKRAPEVGIDITIPLMGKERELDEFARNSSVNLVEVYDRERQNSNLYVPLTKFQFLFSNKLQGKAMTPSEPYPPFNNNLYYVNVDSTKELSFLTENTIQWAGFPQYNEFAFIRTDYNVTGYTAPPNEHILFNNSAATFYNWYFYLTIPSENDDEKELYYNINNDTPIDENLTTKWKPKDGLPFIMQKVTAGGRVLWRFTSLVNHNLNVGDYVFLQAYDVPPDGLYIFNGCNCNASDIVVRDLIFEVYSLGDGTLNSDKKIFNILDLNLNNCPDADTEYPYPCSNSFRNGKTGKFFRIIDPNNSQESKSSYYIRKHKVITKWEDAILTGAGFEENAFRTTSVFQPKDLTPNQSSFVAIKENSQSYNVSFNGTVDLEGILDNQGRPVTELFVTIINRGYFGYFNPKLQTNPGVNFSKSLKQGWEFNMNLNSDTIIISDWWKRTNFDSYVNLEIDTYSKTYTTNSEETTLNFYYNKSYNVGDLIEGDLCEWNEITQQETVLSKIYHKIVYNNQVFTVGGDEDNPKGYYYRPFFKIQLRVFSDYVEQGLAESTEDVPFYAYYSRNNNSFIWRDLYTFGFFDANGSGVDYPFMNNRHYPYQNFIFRLIPEGTNISNIYDIETPIFDGCE